MTSREIARLFCRNLRAELPAETIAQIVRLNAAESDSSICHSHDFCDANEPMAAAFESAMGREIELGSGSDCALWDSAWTIAKESGFSLS